MKPSVPSTPFENVPGPDNTLKFLRTCGSLISTGRWSPATVIVILVVVPFANTTTVTLKIRRRQKAAEIIRFIVPPLSLVGYLQLRRGPLSRSVQNSQYLHFLFADFVHCEERTRQHELASTLDAPGASPVWKRAKALNHAQDTSSATALP